MFDICKLPLQYGISVMARIAAGGVNPYTLALGEAMGLSFRMGRQGRLNLEHALSELSAVSTLGNTLEIGFGVEDVARIMARSEGGAMQLGLCAALTECFSEEICIEVLLEYARSTKADGHYMPSSMEWRNLLHACAGALAGSSFPLRAEHLMSLAKGERRLAAYGSLEALPDARRGCSGPKSIAEGLLALAKLSLKKMQSVTFRGGPSTAWLAAVADWFLDLRVSIVSEGDQEILFTNYVGTEDIQVRVVFAEIDIQLAAGKYVPVGPVVRPGILERAAASARALNASSGGSEHEEINIDQPTTEQADNTSKKRKRPLSVVQTLDVRDQTYFLDLEDVTKIFSQENREPQALIVSGRVEWKKVLRSAFLSEFTHLMEVKSTLSAYLASTARMFQAVATGDKRIPFRYLAANTGYCDAAFGNGFVHNIIHWFPELTSLRGEMETTLRDLSFGGAKKKLEMCISMLRAHCNCRVCSTSSNGFAMEDNDEEMASVRDDESSVGTTTTDTADDWDANRFCEVVIAETIVTLSRSFANVSLTYADLCPMRSGLEVAYGRQLNLRRSAAAGRQALNDLGPIAFCMDFDNNFSIAMQEGNEEAVELTLLTVLETLTGCRATSTHTGVSARWVRGITAFLGVLKDGPCEERNETGRIYVVPGRINFEGKAYTSLTDGTPNITQGSTAAIDSDDYMKTFFSASSNHVSTGLSVRERSTTLQCLFEFVSSYLDDSGPTPRVAIGPSCLATILASRRGLVCCKSGSGRRCPELKEARRHWTRKKLYVHSMEVDMGGKRAVFLKHPGNVSNMIAIASMANLPPTYTTYIVESECHDCCLRTALAVDRPERTVFCFIHIRSS